MFKLKACSIHKLLPPLMLTLQHLLHYTTHTWLNVSSLESFKSPFLRVIRQRFFIAKLILTDTLSHVLQDCPVQIKFILIQQISSFILKSRKPPKIQTSKYQAPIIFNSVEYLQMSIQKNSNSFLFDTFIFQNSFFFVFQFISNTIVMFIAS